MLVTGAAGFVGANLARRLLRDGHRVHLLVRRGSPRWRLDALRRGATLHEVDLTDARAVTAVVRQAKPRWVFHLAAYGAYSWQTDVARMEQTNVVGTMNLVQACLHTGFDAFVHTGSSSEYGRKARAPSEREWLEPNSHYAVTKAAATLFCRYTAQSEGVHLPTLRLYSVFGPWEEPGRLLPTLILHGLRRRLPPLVAPETARDFVYVDDVCDAYLRAATVPDQERGAVYNVGTGVQTSLRELVEMARRVMGLTARPRWGSMPTRRWDTTAWVADGTRARTTLGWTPRYDVEAGFRRMLAWLSRPAIREHYAAAASSARCHAVRR